VAHKERRKEGCGECKLTRVGSADRGQRKQPAALGILGFWESFLLLKSTKRWAVGQSLSAYAT